jgi:heme-degrading monooxygenase HmoA
VFRQYLPIVHVNAKGPLHMTLFKAFRTFALFSLAPLLGACAIGTPFPKLAVTSGEAAEQPVVLVLTKVVVDQENRAEFDRQNSRVIASMNQQPGLLGFGARRELFGPQGWTITIWADEASRSAFVRSGLHGEAISRSRQAIVGAEFKRLTLPRKDLPGDWDTVLQMLADPQGRRSYWE